jgi:hypothetical protein
MRIKYFLPFFAVAALSSDEIPFERHTIDLGRSEACAVADINGDGRADIISGEHWYEAPSWKKHQYKKDFVFNNYLDDFSDLPLDVDGDGDIDIITAAWGSRRLAWFENPGDGRGMWKEHIIDQGSPTEFAFLVDLDNDGLAEEVLPQYGGREGYTAWYKRKGRGKDVQWNRHIVSNKLHGHGIGAGDVNGDGRNDILTPEGWLEAPADPTQGDWRFHSDWSYDKLGFIYVLDVDGDGLNDVVSSRAHDYGVFWLQQQRSPSGVLTWKEQLIDDAWSQAHAMTLVDLTGDGQLELVTGKRLYAHNGHDPGGREPLGLYWYQWVDTGQKREWVRHILDYGGRVGGGMQIPVVDLDGDGDLDIVVAGKGGLFVFENRLR